MRYDLFGPADRSWIFEEITSRSEEEQEEFRQLFYSKMLNAHTPVEVAQKALGASSAVEVAQKALGASSAVEVALKALGASSPVEVALKAIQTEEQRRTLLAYLQQMSLTTTGAEASA